MATKNKNIKKFKFCPSPMTKLKFKWMKFIYNDNRKNISKNIFASLVSIVISLLIALLLVVIIYRDGSLFSDVVKYIFIAPFKGKFNEGHAKETISSISIFAMAALSFIFAQKVGLFNIGISGQMLFGGQVGTIVGFGLHHHIGTALGIGQLLVIITAMLSGALIATIINILKVYLNVNEVITSILFNWIVFFLGTLFVRTILNKMGHIDAGGLYTESLPNDVSLNISNWNAIMNGSWLPLTIITAIVIPSSIIVLNCLTFGKKIKVTGLNVSASMYAGINVKSKQLVAMLISGLIAGLLGAMIYCGQTNNLFITTATKAIPTRGFDGISVGLISMNNPVAVLPISLFFAMIENAKSTIQAECSVDPVVADLMFGVIVYGAAIISLVYYFRPWIWLRKLFDGKNNENNYYKYQNDQAANIEHINSTIYVIRNYYQINRNIISVKQKLQKLILLTNNKLKININHNNFIKVVNKLRKKYGNKLPKKLQNKKLNTLLTKLLELYKERKDLFKSPATHKIIIKAKIDPKRMNDIKYVKNHVKYLTGLTLLVFAKNKNDFKKSIILNKESNFDTKMVYMRLNRFYKDKLAEANVDYDIQKQFILKNNTEKYKKIKIKKLNLIYHSAIKRLKFEIKCKKRYAKSLNPDENALFYNFHKYLDKAYKIYLTKLNKTVKIQKNRLNLKFKHFKYPFDTEIKKIANKLSKSQIILGESYSLYLNQINKIINYKTKVAYKLAKNNIKGEYIKFITNKYANGGADMLGGNR